MWTQPITTFFPMGASPINNNFFTMPEVTTMLHSPQLSQPTPSLVKCLYQLRRWDGWETVKKKQGGRRRGKYGAKKVQKRLQWLIAVILPNLALKAFYKGCRLFLVKVKEVLMKMWVPLHLKTTTAVNKLYFCGRTCLCSLIFITTHTNKLTVSSLHCVNRIGRAGKKRLPFRRQESGKCGNESTHLKSLYKCAGHLHLQCNRN